MKAEIEELFDKIKVFSGKNDYTVICHKDGEERTKELFPSVKVLVLPEEFHATKANGTVFIIPTDEKPVKVVYEENLPLDIEIKGTIYTKYID